MDNKLVFARVSQRNETELLPLRCVAMAALSFEEDAPSAAESALMDSEMVFDCIHTLGLVLFCLNDFFGQAIMN